MHVHAWNSIAIANVVSLESISGEAFYNWMLQLRLLCLILHGMPAMTVSKSGAVFNRFHESEYLELTQAKGPWNWVEVMRNHSYGIFMWTLASQHYFFLETFFVLIFCMLQLIIAGIHMLGAPQKLNVANTCNGRGYAFLSSAALQLSFKRIYKGYNIWLQKLLITNG